MCVFVSAFGQAEQWVSRAEKASAKGKYDSVELYYRKATDPYYWSPFVLLGKVVCI